MNWKSNASKLFLVGMKYIRQWLFYKVYFHINRTNSNVPTHKDVSKMRIIYVIYRAQSFRC